MEKKLPYVLADCDGTISPKHNYIAEDTTADILLYQKKSKHCFGLITGRLDVTNKELVQKLKITLPIVSCNGALISDPTNWKVLHAEYLDKEVVVNILRETAEKNIGMMVFEPGAICGLKAANRIKYWNEYKENIKKKHDFEMKTYDTVSAFADDIVNEKVKAIELIIVAENKEEVKVMRKILDKYENKIQDVQSLPILFNITKKGVNKASGLKNWAKIMKTKYEDVVVFGDNYNDLDMVKIVDHGYAVGNSVSDLKKIAFKVVDPMDENGVGKKLKEILNNEY